MKHPAASSGVSIGNFLNAPRGGELVRLWRIKPLPAYGGLVRLGRIELVTIHGQFVDTQGFDITVCEDSDDDKFLECAVGGKCKTIISGDKHLLKISGYEGITVLRPRNLVDKYL